MASRQLLRSLNQSNANFRRSFSGHGKGPEGEKALKRWRNAFLLLGCPAVGFLFVNAVFLNDLHGERPEFVAYPHLRIRNKAFPWGDGNKSLFHSPHYNALPDGYEEGDHGH